MKDVIRGGHSLDVRGASGVVDEVTEDRKITAKVIEYLKLDGNEVLDATPSNSGTSIVDLSVPVNKANSWGADYFASIHLNAGGGKGVEVLYKSAKGKEYAERIVNKIAELGFTNRGAKADVRGLYEFNHVIAPNNIIEVFFCDSQADVDLYNKLGIDVIAKAIAEGIVGHSIGEKPVSQTSQPVVEQPKPQPILQSEDNSVLITQQKLRRLHIPDYEGKQIICDNAIGERTRSAIRKFEEIMGLSVDSGIWGGQCERAYQEITSKPYCDRNNQTNKYAIKYIQWLCGANPIDGLWGNISDKCVYNWQIKSNLVPDKKFGNRSWDKAIG